jgi:hypothetical protein
LNDPSAIFSKKQNMPTTEETPQPIEKLLNLETLAGRWDVSMQTVKNRWHEGDLKAVRIGRRLLFRLEDIIAYEDARRK